MYFPFFKQEDNWDCSIACVFMVSNYFQKNNSNYHELIKKTNHYQDLNLLEIEELGVKLNLTLISYFIKWEKFKNNKIKKPIICQIKNGNSFHFIVIYKKYKNEYLIADPEKNEIEWISSKKLKQKYTSIVLFCSEKKFSINELLKEKMGLNFLQNLTIPIITLLLISIISTILTISLQFLLKIIIDEILIKKITSQILIIFFSFSLIFLVNLIINLIFEKIKFKLEIFYKKKWNILFFQKIKLLNYIDFKKYSLTTILRTYKYFNEIISFYFPNLINLFHNFFFIIASITIIFIFNYWIVFFIFLFLLIYLIIYIFILPTFNNLQNKKNQTEKEFSKILLTFIKNQNDLKRRNIDLILNQEINYKFNEILKINSEKNIFQITTNTIINSIKFLSKISIIYSIIFLTSNNIQIGYFLFLIMISENIIEKSLNTFFFYNQWIKIKKFKKIITPFLKNKKEENNKEIIWNNKNEINIKNLNFYFKKDDFIWNQNLNLNINKNTSIYGDSGIGKTTLLQLIYGELTPSIGKIEINKNFKINNSNSFQKNIIFITNNSKVFNGTILENIFNFKNTKNNLKKFLENKLDEWLKKVNLKIFDEIKNKNLSSGQKQIIIFLSLFFVETKIILLDEPLNSVNIKVAEELMIFFIKKNKNKLILIVSHRKKINKLFEKKINLYAK